MKSKFLPCFFLGLLSVPVLLLAATTGSLTLTGYIPEIVSIVVEPTAAQHHIDLIHGETNLEVAKIITHTNGDHDYKIMVHSTNGGVFRQGETDGPRYTATYNSIPILLNASQDTTLISKGTAGKKLIHSLRISLPANLNPSPVPGKYRDTLTFTIAVL